VTEHGDGKTGPEERGKSAYEAPRIVWEEDYQPTAFAAVSCALDPGNPGCASGPSSS
jgi:hypothetical protein